MALIFLIGLILLTLVAMGMVIFPLLREKRYRAVASIFIAFPVCAMSFYFYLGTAKQEWHYWFLQKEARQVKLAMASIQSPEEVVDRLKAHLKAHPNSPKGWFLLGRLYLSLDRYAEAVNALRQAHFYDLANTTYSTTYAEALFFYNNRQLNREAKQLLQSVLSQHPFDINAINLFAIDAYNKGNYKIAIHFWEKLIPLFPPGSKDSQALLSMIAQVQKKLSGH